MKHGISPTTPRNLKHERQVFVSKPLAKRVTLLDEETGRLRVDYLPLHIDTPPGATFQNIVVAPMKGKTYRRTDPKVLRPGRIRRTALAEMRAAGTLQ